MNKCGKPNCFNPDACNYPNCSDSVRKRLSLKNFINKYQVFSYMMAIVLNLVMFVFVYLVFTNKI